MTGGDNIQTINVSQKQLRSIVSSAGNDPLVFLETARFDRQNSRSFIFKDLQDTIRFDVGDDLDQYFRKIEWYLKKGLWLAGYFSYEFGYLLEQTLASHIPKSLPTPLAWLGVYSPPLVVEHRGNTAGSVPETKAPLYRITDITPNITEDQYNEAIEKIKWYLREGETYQVNFTFQLKCTVSGSCLDLYHDLRLRQPTSYMAFVNTGSDIILSFSPELFFRLDGNRILTRPMKGTASRGRFLEEDMLRENWLKNNPKNRAENLMIVDLLRNDLGRVAQRGSVKVKNLFSIERYLTVLQMTSTIEAVLKRDTNFKTIMDALFPSGSVTGAPKIRTMQIIRELEKEPRNVYTGAIGFLSPHNQACFNVAIRTIHIDAQKRATLGIGGGIVYDSSYKKEYNEAILKSHFLVRKIPPFSLIETMRWNQQQGYFLFDLHLKRLQRSTSYFSIPYNEKRIIQKLAALTKVLGGSGAYKVRLCLNRGGQIHLEYSLLEELPLPIKVRIGHISVDSEDSYLYHKTTHRPLYEQEKVAALKEGYSEVIFTNQKGQLTEGTFTNLFLLKNSVLYTPPLRCGLLGGVLREHLLRKKRVIEKILYPNDIIKAERVFLGNSVRGLMEARVCLSSRKQEQAAAA